MATPGAPEFPHDWGSPDGPRSFPWTNWTAQLGPVPWPTRVGGRSDTDVQWYVDGALEFLDKAYRPKARLAMPLVGTGAGGAGAKKGGVADALVRGVLEWVKTHEADVVLVLDTAEKYAACQQVRDREFTWNLAPAVRAVAEELASCCRKGELALFLGAGVSLGAGLPSWNALIERLAEKAGYPARVLQELENNLDQAQLLSHRLGPSFKTEVADCLRADRYSLAHGLLAGLDVHEAVTQNYDQLFEMAWEAVDGERPSVLPGAPRDARRWLLKMHGCISQPQSIVLTREDFLRYAMRRGALAGLVQGMLLTRHMLFYGFSLRDDNFISIVDEVRKARQGARKGWFGTVLTSRMPVALKDLWDQEIRILSLDDFRQLEILLDYLGARSRVNREYLLDDSFEPLLSDQERWLKRELLGLRHRAPSEVRQTAAWSSFEEFLGQLGLPG